MTAFKTQQARWAKGLIQCAKKDLPYVLQSDVSRREKMEAWYHLTANLSYPLMIVLSTLLMPAMIIRSYQGWFQMLCIDLPLFLASTFSISSFYLVSQKELFPKHGCALSCICPPDGARHRADHHQQQSRDGSAHRIKSPFARTPKYRVVSKKEKSEAAKKYRKRLGLIPYVELLIGCYFAVTIWYAVDRELLHGSLLVPVCVRILVHGYHVAAARPLRCLRARAQRKSIV